MSDLWLDFEWAPVFSEEQIPYSFPQPISKFLKNRYSKPAVYRWTVKSGSDLRMVYYGEAEILSRRIGNYQRGHPSQQTAARINRTFRALDAELRIGLEVLHFRPFLLNGVVIDEPSLHKDYVRCFLENALISISPPGVELLNRAASVQEKQIKKAVDAFEKLSTSQREVVVETLKREAQTRNMNATQE